jgi:hypoxanthine phosphoribosyltransferase
MQKEYISPVQMDGYYKDLIQQMAKANYKPEVVIGLARGGADMAVKFSHYFDIPCEILKWQTRDGNHGNPVPVAEVGKMQTLMSAYRNVNILIVDDIYDTGKTLADIDMTLDACNKMNTITYAVCIENLDADAVEIDFSARQISRSDDEQWFVFPCENWWLY